MLNQPDELRDFIHNQASTCPLPYGHSAGTSPNIRTKTKANATTTTRNNSVKDVEQTMNEMDRLNSTSFASWVRSEKNIQYLCLYKGKLIREYVETDPKSALFALEWLVQDWKTESVAVLILKLFYKDRLSSPKFINRLDGITHSWDLIKIKELIPILLVGETVETAADFTLNLKRTASYDSAKLLEIVSTLVIAFSWNCTEMVEFLIAYCLRAVNDDRNKHTFVFLIRNEFNRIDQYNGGALVGLELFRVVFRVLLLDIPFDSASLIFDEVFNEIESW